MQENIGSVKQESSDSAAQIKETISDIDQRIQQDLQGFQTSIEERIAALNQTFSSNIQNISGQVESEADFNEETKAQINTLFSRIDEINEKLYEFEVNKKNNLIFYGLAGENRETPSVLIMKVWMLWKNNQNCFIGSRLDQRIANFYFFFVRLKANYFLDKLNTEADSLPEERYCHHESCQDANWPRRWRLSTYCGDLRGFQWQRAGSQEGGHVERK